MVTFCALMGSQTKTMEWRVLHPILSQISKKLKYVELAETGTPSRNLMQDYQFCNLLYVCSFASSILCLSICKQRKHYKDTISAL